MDTNSVLFALLLTLIAGLSTSIGSLIALLVKKTNRAFLSASLGLSAGVMIYVSFMELMPVAEEQLSLIYSDSRAELYMVLSFFAGIGMIWAIDMMIPKDKNPHEIQSQDPNQEINRAKLKRTGIMVALAVGIHNFPEGLATFTASLTDLEVAIPIVIATAIHNIPEGIAVSVPFYYATGSRRKAFIYSSLSGLAEPVGALCGWLFLQHIWSPTISALLLAFVSGIMVYISLDELLPSTEKYGHHHWGIIGVIFGMAIMALSLLML